MLPSASLVPENDPSVLFTTAGMQQFKRYYLFPKEAPSARIATIQKCVRTGDIDEVGDTTHLTFFEMLGNFSFGYPKESGSYFKEDSIKWAWEFLTKELNVEIGRLSATYFAGDDGIPADNESLLILKKVTGLPEDKIKGTGKDETFWSLGTEGSPGGPTVEFYIDGIEIWNLVFNEYVMEDGKYQPSESKGVDTGMGLERLMQVLNKQESVYHIDTFASAYHKIHQLYSVENHRTERIVLDHLRSAIFILSDKVSPNNKGQGYILRRLIRRAMVEGRKIGIGGEGVQELLLCFIDPFASVYDEFQTNQSFITDQISQEIVRFNQTIDKGMKEFERQKDNLNGEIAFNLYQTYGFPWELTAELAIEAGIKVDRSDFERSFKEHKELSRTASAGMFKGGLADNKEETTRLHTAAHLLLAALRQVLSNEVNQKGSNITEERLRFDFNWPEKLTDEQIKNIEELVNKWIGEKLPVKMEEMSTEEAKQSGATGVFDDRYGDRVKVYTIGPSTSLGSRDFISREICGGPHVENTDELGKFKITKEESSSSGIRRIKAVLI